MELGYSSITTTLNNTSLYFLVDEFKIERGSVWHLFAQQEPHVALPTIRQQKIINCENTTALASCRRTTTSELFHKQGMQLMLSTYAGSSSVLSTQY